MSDLTERLREAQWAALTRQLCHEAADEIERLNEMIRVSSGLKCPNCPDEGYTAEQDGHGEWYQVQCEFCYTVPESAFRRAQDKADG